MGYLFDGPNRRIVLTAGTTVLDVVDMYSRWKDWVALTDNSKFLEAFAPVGGEPVDVANGIFVTGYFFLQNGWRVRPQESNHKLQVKTGVLLTSDGSDPFVSTIGSFNVLVQYSQPIKTETVLTGGSTVPTAAEIADAVWDEPAGDHVGAGSTGELQVAAAITGLTSQQATMLLEIYRLLGLDATCECEHGTTYVRCPPDGSGINIVVANSGGSTKLTRVP